MDASVSGHPGGRIARLGDDLNPVLVKELRQAVQGRYVFAVLATFLVASLGLMVWLILDGRAELAKNLAGREFFQLLYLVLMAGCLLFIPPIAGLRMHAERSGQTADLMFITTLAPEEITRGKLRASAVVTLIIFCACLPFTAIAYLMRGIDVPTILLVLVWGYLTVLIGTSLAMAAGSRPGSMGKLVLAVVAAGFYLGVCVEVVRQGMETIRRGVGDLFFDPTFWGYTVPNLVLAAVFVRLFSRNAAGHFERPRTGFWTHVRGDLAFAVALWVLSVFTSLARPSKSPAYALSGLPGFALLVLGRLTMPRFRPGRPPLMTPMRRALSQTGVQASEEDAARERVMMARRMVKDFFEPPDGSRGQGFA